MIVTLTPNPCLDRTVALPGVLERGAVLRVDSELSQPGGKGVNISRACVAAGVPTIAVLPAAADDPYIHELDLLGVATATVPPAGPMRVNLTITEPDGTTTKLNTAGATVAPADLVAMADALLAQPESGWVVVAGSLPPGAPAEWYVDLAARLRAAGRTVAVDTSDAALAALVAGIAPDTAPHLLKPNAEELASATGADPTALESDPLATARAAQQLVQRGVRAVLATLGGAGAVLVDATGAWHAVPPPTTVVSTVGAGDAALHQLLRGVRAVLATLGGAGAVLVDATGAWHAVPPPTTVVSTVGAGDASLFGYVLADLQGLSAPERLASAVAYGSAAAGLPGSTVPTPADAHPELVRVSALGLSPATPL